MTDDAKLTRNEVFIYGLSGFFSTLAFATPMGYLQLFLTEDLFIGAAVLGTAFLIARVIDFFLTLVAGATIENSRPKTGKYSSWTASLRWVILAGMLLCMLPTTSLPVGAKLTIAMIGYLLFNGTMNFTATANMGILSVVAGPSMQDRIRLSLTSFRMLTVASVITSAGVLPTLNLLGRLLGESGKVWRYEILTAFLSIFYIIGTSFLLRLSRPKDVYFDANAPQGSYPKVKISDMVKAVAGNDQLLIYMLTMFTQFFGLYTGMAGIVYYFIYVLGNLNWMPLFSTCMTLWSLVTMTFGPKIGLKLGRKRAMVITLLWGAAFSVLVIFFAKINIWVYIGISMFSAAGGSLISGYGANYILDVGEYGYWKTGKDNRTVVMSMMNVPIKLATALGGSVGLWLLAAIGYVPGMGAPGLPAIPANFTDSLMLIMGGVPAVCNLIAGLLFLFFYRIDDEKAATYARENAAKQPAFGGFPPPQGSEAATQE